MTIDLIVNPASGPVVGGQPREHRLAFAIAQLKTLGVQSIRPTQTAAIGDATRAAAEARRLGSDRVVVWGGDGTLNEVAAALLDGPVPMAIVPGGSGNGLARGLAIPLSVEPALRAAVVGAAHRIDTGRVTGRAFLNLAGVGFDAAIARRVNTNNLRRGLRPYVSAIFHEFRSYGAQAFSLRLDDGETTTFDAHMVAVCNGQQYGHGARIAPHAAFDDGWLDVVVVPEITGRRLARHGWRLFNGTLAQVPGVRVARARHIVLSHPVPLPVHLDGEVVEGEKTHTFEINPRSLAVVFADR
ncbi:MAG TPA: YegS/Rv2252/BmrU family lipid kinase [Luteitalea sp.]|nr:YegS/Rv2252/BmrU family lipid kinase [Luteitalea sp.]